MSIPSLPASSTLAVAGQPSPSLVRRAKKSFPNLWLPLSPFPSYSWDVQDLENTQGSRSSTSTQSQTPGLSWDSRPTTVTLGEPQLRSIFEDWDDDTPASECRVVIEDDGVQTLLLTPSSPFFHPPPSPRPFGYEPFSRGLHAAEVPIRHEESYAEVPASAYFTLTPAMFHLAPHQPEPSPKATRGRMLFIDTSSPARNSFSLSAFVYSAQPADDIPSWAPKQLLRGPDVPLEVDYIYSASDVSPIDRWDEKLWSSPLARTAPCF